MKTKLPMRLFIYASLVLASVVTIFPLLWMLKVSVQSPSADAMDLKRLLPDSIHLENYAHAMREMDFALALFNSVFVTLAVTVGLVFVSALAAYAFARLRFRGRNTLFILYLSTMMVPATVVLVPRFVLLREMHLLDTYWAIILPQIFGAYGVFMLRQFFLSIPREIEEAAIIDGCSHFGVFWRVVLPVSRPALAALSILTFIGSWRTFMWPLIAVSSRRLFTLPLQLAQFQELYGVQWSLLMAGSVIMVLPMVFVFIIGQRHIVEGIQLGAVKG